MIKTAIHTANAPQAIGPYSQAVDVGDMLFVSGQIPVDPGTGDIVRGGIAEQTSRIIDNIEAVLGAAGLTLADVVKTTVFLTDLNDFATVNGVYAQRFPSPYPARSCVQVAALPKGAKAEIEVIAIKRQG